jgi:tetratricopeptide (TPR) repeat protein
MASLIFSKPKAWAMLIPLFLFAEAEVFPQVKMTEEMWILPTYKVMPSEKAPMFYSGGSFQGARRIIYPYALNDVISNEKVKQAWKALILENEYIRLCVTPEIGGKLYYATDKSNDYNFIYKNNEVKPANIGMTGAWVSGGIEWCVLHHHRASTMLPMDYTMTENADGSKTIWIGETEPRHRMRWNVGVTVRPGKSYFEAEMSIYNPTPFTHTFLYWANVAAHTNENYQTIFPPSVQMATFHSKNDFTYWPFSTEEYRGQDFTEGVDISWWKNVKSSASFFSWDLKEDFMGGYDHGKNAGTVHIGDHNIVKGAKLWEWGSGPRGQATEGRLTETSGPYVEIMVGAYSDNQPDYTWIKPGETKRWKQYWYPVKDIGGFKNANLDAAVNLEKQGENKVFLGYHSTQKLDKARIILKKGNEIIFQKEVEISPERAFAESIEIKAGFHLTDLYTEMVSTVTDELVISYQPKDIVRPASLPAVVEPPASPEDIATIEELYLTATRLEQFYKISMPYFEEALKRDPNDMRTNTAVGNIYLKNGDYETARKHFSTAIKRLTTDYTRPENGEALYLQGVALKALGLYNEAIDTLYRATWDYAYYSAAYFELAQISCMQGDFEKALQQIEESLSTNTRNSQAASLKASIQRKLGDVSGAAATLAAILQKDPLNFRALYEIYLVSKALENVPQSEKRLAEFYEKMRDFNQNYLDLAVGYLNDGMPEEADEVLDGFTGKDPIVYYYLGFIADGQGKKDEASKYFSEAQALSEAYCFPFRLETLNVLQKAIAYNEDDTKAYYYMGNILYDKQAEKAIEYWEKAIENNPELAMAYRNLGWGYYRNNKDLQKAISYYEKSIALDNGVALFYTELDKLYELNNSPIKARLKIFEGNQDAVYARDDAFIRQITVLTLAGKPEKSVRYLDGKSFSYREGTSKVRETIIDAHLTLGIKNFEAEDYDKALEQFLLAQVPDEEAGSARFGNRNIQVDYYIAKAYAALNDKKNAKVHYEKAASVETSGRPGIMNYYQGLSLLELNDKKKAKDVFNLLIAEGDKRLHSEPDEKGEFFAIFGEREAETTRKSMAHTLRGLGYNGLGEIQKAQADLAEAVELSVSNLWASIELNGLN